MEFCKLCKNIMAKRTQSGDVINKCTQCENITIGNKYGTLFYEETSTTAENDKKYDIFLENVPYDKAPYRVKNPCPKCKLPYRTLVRIGRIERSKLVCSSCHEITDY